MVDRSAGVRAGVLACHGARTACSDRKAFMLVVVAVYTSLNTSFESC